MCKDANLSFCSRLPREWISMSFELTLRPAINVVFSSLLSKPSTCRLYVISVAVPVMILTPHAEPA